MTIKSSAYFIETDNIVMNANWEKHGKSAGYKRNQEMANVSTHLIAFWDGKSRGTKHMIDIAKRDGLKSHFVGFNGKPWP